MFLASDKGKRILNFFYSWGASIVILGAMFKILHLPYGGTMLAIGMTTEFFVFFIFGFEKPHSDYHWEDVFPALKSKNPLDKNESNNVATNPVTFGNNTVIIGTNAGTPVGTGEMPQSKTDGTELQGMNVTQQPNINGFVAGTATAAATEACTSAATQGLKEITEKYTNQLSSISEQVEQFGEITKKLTEVSEKMLDFYRDMTNNSDSVIYNSKGYIQQMENLNRNISGLNTIYEIQLKSISTQIENIEHINSGLNRIKDLYDGSVVDSSVFRRENERMAQQLTQLNQVYSRMLQAMTVNMYTGNVPPQQPDSPNPYASHGYQQPERQ